MYVYYIGSRVGLTVKGMVRFNVPSKRCVIGLLPVKPDTL